MKRNCLLLLFPSTLFLLQSCKKDKADDQPPNPIAAYDFNNNAKNSVSQLHHGTTAGAMAITTDSFGTAKSAYLFDGAGYIRIPDSDVLDFPGNQFSFAAWIYPTKTENTYVIHKGVANDSDLGYALDIFPGNAHAFVYTNTDEHFEVTGTSKIIKDVWQHIAVTFGNEQLTIYYNGKSEGSTAVDRPLKITNGELVIGTYKWAFPAGSFQGKIDQVRLYDKVLTAAQVMYLYKNYK